MIWGFLGRFKGWAVAAGLFALLLLSSWLHGGTRQKLRAARRTAKTQKDMHDADAQTSRDPDDVARRLRDGRF